MTSGGGGGHRLPAVLGGRHAHVLLEHALERRFRLVARGFRHRPRRGAASAGGFPAMVGNVPFLMKDVVLLAVSIYLLKQDVQRVLIKTRAAP
jgi:hypothetical protein